MYLSKLSISNLPAVLFDGVYRVCGCLPETGLSAARLPRFGAHFANALDPSLWQEIDLEWYQPPILDQGQSSACVGHSVCSGMEMCVVQSGRALVEFAPFFTYGLINGGRDAGAQISDALLSLKQYGICPKGDLPSGVMFQAQFPKQSFTDALRWRLAEAFHCPTFEDICSAISLGFVCPLGLYVGDNFSQLDSEGVCPLPAGGGGGHAVLGMGLKKSSRYGWLIKFQNSWGLRFGNKGYGYLRKDHFKMMPPDAFAVQTVTEDPLAA